MLTWKGALSLVGLLVLCSCGYQIVGKETHVPPGIGSIAIPTFVNRTYEPGIEIPITQAFLQEFIQDRRVKVVARSEADSILEGVVRDFSLYSVSYDKAGLVLEYRTNAVVDLTLKKPTGAVIWEEKGFHESRWFRASTDTLINETNKNAAIQEIGRLMAGRIKNRFFYNF